MKTTNVKPTTTTTNDNKRSRNDTRGQPDATTDTTTANDGFT